MTPFWLFQAPEIRKSLFGVFRGLKWSFFGTFRGLKWYLLGFFRPLKSDGAFLELKGTLNYHILAFSGAWKGTLLAEKGDILNIFWHNLLMESLLNISYIVVDNKSSSDNPWGYPCCLYYCCFWCYSWCCCWLCHCCVSNCCCWSYCA